MTAAEIAGDPGAGWDEAQCASALAQLERLQAQIDELRLAIPRVVEPFQRPPSAGMFRQYARGVQGSQQEIKTLHEQWRSPEIQTVFENTRKSLTINSDLSASKSTPAHGWTEREKSQDNGTNGGETESTGDVSSALSEEEVARILAEFRKSNPSIKLETQDDSRVITTQFVASSIKLRFHVTIEYEANGKHRLNVDSVGSTEPWLSINRCIASRPHPNDLATLLDMIAAYKNVKGTSCAKCGRLLDDLALTPTARRSKQIAAPKESSETVWEALHESCLG